MNKQLNIQDILDNKSKYHSVTITENEGYFEAYYFIKDAKSSKPVKKQYLSLKGKNLLPMISNWLVKHLGYKRFYHLKDEGFYINLYFNTDLSNSEVVKLYNSNKLLVEALEQVLLAINTGKIKGFTVNEIEQFSEAIESAKD